MEGMAPPVGIRAVTFDVGGTLLDPWPSVGHVYAQVAGEHGFTGIAPDDLTERFAVAWKVRSSFGYTKSDWAAVVDDTFRGVIPVKPSETFFDAIYRRFDHPDAWRIHDDVLCTLGELRQAGLKLGVISNWDDRLHPLLHRLDLARWFDALSISCEVGATKPAREIFDAAAAGLGVAPGTVLHVGDSASADVAGARAAGFRALRIDRGIRVRANGEIRSLTQIIGLVTEPPPDMDKTM